MAIKGDVINGPLMFMFLFMGIRVIVLVNGPELMVKINSYANYRKHYSGVLNYLS